MKEEEESRGGKTLRLLIIITKYGIYLSGSKSKACSIEQGFGVLGSSCCF
jgi:hypothetical protein